MGAAPRWLSHYRECAEDKNPQRYTLHPLVMHCWNALASRSSLSNSAAVPLPMNSDVKYEPLKPVGDFSQTGGVGGSASSYSVGDLHSNHSGDIDSMAMSDVFNDEVSACFPWAPSNVLIVH